MPTKDEDKKLIKRKPAGRPIRAAKKNLEDQEKGLEKKLEQDISDITPDSVVEVPIDSGEQPSAEINLQEVKDDLNSTEPITKMQSDIAASNLADSLITESPQASAFVRKSILNSRLFIIALFVGLLIGTVAFGGFVAYDSGISVLNIQPTPTLAPTVTPTPTKKPLDLKSYKLHILNGTGISGAAKVIGDLLSPSGFEDMDYGNANEFGFNDTEVAMKNTVPEEVFEEIKKSLIDYNVVEVTALSEDAVYDIEITVGSPKTEN